MSPPRRALALVSVGLSALASSACIEPQTLGTLKMSMAKTADRLEAVAAVLFATR